MAYNRYSNFEVISSVIVYVVFLAAVVGIFYLTRKAEEATEQTKAALREKGVTINRSGVSVQTSRVAPSREEYIASTQRAFENSAAKVAANREAFRFGDTSAALSNATLSFDSDDLAGASSLSRKLTNSTTTQTTSQRTGAPPPGSAAAEGLEAAHGQEMTTSLGAVRGDGAWNEGQVPVGPGEVVDALGSVETADRKRSIFRRHKKAAV